MPIGSFGVSLRIPRKWSWGASAIDGWFCAEGPTINRVGRGTKSHARVTRHPHSAAVRIVLTGSSVVVLPHKSFSSVARVDSGFDPIRVPLSISWCNYEENLLLGTLKLYLKVFTSSC